MTSYCYFRVRCSTIYKDQVKIAGNVPELGSWDVSKAFPLETDEYVYPNWNNQDQLVLNYTKIEYKIIIVRGQQTIWESISNRVLELKHFKQIVFISFDNPEVKVIPLIKELKESKDFEEEQLIQVRKINVLELSYQDSSFYEVNSLIYYQFLKNSDDECDLNIQIMSLETNSDSMNFSDIQEVMCQFLNSPIMGNHTNRNDLNSFSLEDH